MTEMHIPRRAGLKEMMSRLVPHGAEGGGIGWGLPEAPMGKEKGTGEKNAAGRWWPNAPLTKRLLFVIKVKVKAPCCLPGV